MSRNAWIFGILWLLIAAACSRAGGRSRDRAPAIRVREGAGQVFVYRSGDGFATADTPSHVPAWARGRVRVLDPKVKPPPGLAYVADLCTKKSDGTYPYEVVPLQEFETAPARGCRGGAAAPRIVLYMSTTCPVCAKAKAWLQAHGIPFAAKLVDQDPKAARELAAKAAAQGLQVGGVPVLDVGGKLVQGFDPAAWARLLQGLEEKR